MPLDTSLARTVLAIDPGYDRIGWAIGVVAVHKRNTNQLQSNSHPSTQQNTHQKIGNSCPNTPKLQLLDFGCIQTNPKNSIGERYKTIQQELTDLCSTHKPTTLAIEQLYFSKNTTTALKVSEARGVIVSSVFPYVTEILEFHPNTLKLAVTGHGQASKAAVEKMVRLQLNLPQQKIIDDAIDALALLLTYSAHYPISHKTTKNTSGYQVLL